MERTYNAFVDNGLYAAGYYLHKEIQDITIDDLKNNIKMFSDIIGDYIRVPKHASVAWSGFTNSSFTTQLKEDKKDSKINNKKIYEQFKELLDNIGTEPCSICGHENGNLDITATRSLLPGISSNTFFNYSNNLQATTICPVCLFLSLLSILNMRKNQNTLLYNSDNDLLMKNYTEMLQNELKDDIKNNSEKEKKKISNYQHFENTLKYLTNQDTKYKGYIVQVAFDNLGQKEEYHENYISAKELNLLYILKNNNLLNEFFDLGFTTILINNHGRNEYIYKLITKENTLKCSKDLFIIIDREMNSVDQETTELIANICQKLSTINQKNEIDALKKIRLHSQYEDLILKWQEAYKKATSENLFDSLEDYEKLVNPKKWISIRRRLISQFIIIYN
ncbi:MULTISPECIES: hypothetical protein [Clostridium]|jgi:CRISPR-associated protein Cst1|uniref:hypothetical protein n=1 Tax=Clostridium TaxID=1485 RepID=UPI0024328C91|nr:hypothetical protein [Clostridium tyrobutyricum]